MTKNNKTNFWETSARHFTRESADPLVNIERRIGHAYTRHANDRESKFKLQKIYKQSDSLYPWPGASLICLRIREVRRVRACKSGEDWTNTNAGGAASAPKQIQNERFSARKWPLYNFVVKVRINCPIGKRTTAKWRERAAQVTLLDTPPGDEVGPKWGLFVTSSRDEPPDATYLVPFPRFNGGS